MTKVHRSLALSLLLLALLLPNKTRAQDAQNAQTPPDQVPLPAVDQTVRFDGLIDAYYGYDFNGPSQFDRSYTTQAARSDEFNINLAYLSATLSDDRLRGRLALQAGTSVQSNYATEPSIGTVSGPSLSRNIQEAFIGYELSKNIWIDGGIYFSHVGAESFISHDNLTYTRSLVADFSPYYQSGLRLSYQASPDLSFQLHLVNGWQTISENNHSKTLGTQVSYALTKKLNVTYNTLIGRESEFRHFHDFVLRFEPNSAWTFAAQADIGFQKRANSETFDSWSGFTLMGKRKLTPATALALRVESYSDPRQIIVTTPAPDGLVAYSASLGLDVALSKRVLWRSEYRHYISTNPVFPSRDGLAKQDALAVTSLSVNL